MSSKKNIKPNPNRNNPYTPPLHTTSSLSSRHVFLSLLLCSLLPSVQCLQPKQPNISNTILVTYKPGCMEAEQRSTVLNRSVRETLVSPRSAKDAFELRRTTVEEQPLTSSSVFVLSREGRFEEGEEGGCEIKETWLKLIGLQLLSLSGECERFGKEEFIHRLDEEECVLSREVDSVRYPSEQMEGDDEKAAKRRKLFIPSDSDLWMQWHLDDSNQFSIGARAAWDMSRGGNGTVYEQPGNTVGVVDFGFLESHPDLIGQWWSNPMENCDVNSNNGVDEDMNGLTDDCHGWNFVKNSGDLSGYSHGTKVAGAAAAASNNSIGISSICSNCKVLAATVGGSVSSELAGVNYVISKGVRVINLSVGGPRSEAEFLTFKNNPNILFVLSSGNEGCNLDAMPATACLDKYNQNAGFPAALSDELNNVVSVGSITSGGLRSSFSNYGANRVQVFAPGSSIRTTSYTSSGPNYSNRSGTSYAAPIVAGVAVLVSQKYPQFSSCQLRQLLILSCQANANLQGKASCNGQVNAAQALLMAASFANNPSALTCQGSVPRSVNEFSANSLLSGPNSFPFGKTALKASKIAKPKKSSKLPSKGSDLFAPGGAIQTQKVKKVKNPKKVKKGTKSKKGSEDMYKKTIDQGSLKSSLLKKKVAPVHTDHLLLQKQKPVHTDHLLLQKQNPMYSSKPLSYPKKQNPLSSSIVPSAISSILSGADSQTGELLVDAMISAIASSGLMVDAHLLEKTVELLLKLFSNFVDPFNFLTHGKPVQQYLHESMRYPSLSKEPVQVLLRPLTLAESFLQKHKQMDSSKVNQSFLSGVVPSGLGFLDVLGVGKALDPLAMAAEMLNLFPKEAGEKGRGGMESKGIWSVDMIPSLLSPEMMKWMDPLQLMIALKQLKLYKYKLLTDKFHGMMQAKLKLKNVY